MSENGFREWCILELMGHRRLAGQVTEAEIGGAKFLRIDVPGEDAPHATQFYSPAAVYCMTPTTEETARAFALNHRPAPISVWDIQRPQALPPGADDAPEDDEAPSEDDAPDDDIPY